MGIPIDRTHIFTLEFADDQVLVAQDKTVSYTHLDVYKRQGSGRSKYCDKGDAIEVVDKLS